MRAKVPGITAVLAVGAAAAWTHLSGCGGSSQNGTMFGELPAPASSATLSGPLCRDGVCRCRQPGDDAGLPGTAGMKRFEFWVGPAENELWVTLDDMVLYKSRETASECFYIDLHTGEHPVKLRAQGKTGFAARLTISELGKKGSYDTFEFVCGGPGSCTLDTLRNWQQSLEQLTRNLHDPCGSTRVRKIEWQTGRVSDRVHPEKLALDFVLDVYEFEPQFASGHPKCRDKK